jgi:hypothetical protein
MKYKYMDLKSFIIGSSLPVFLPFFLSVQNIDPHTKTYSYQNYTIIAPIYLGLMNVIGAYLFNGPNRFLYTGFLSGLTVSFIASYLNVYNYTILEWSNYYFYIILKHVLTFAIVVNFISTHL